MKSVIHVVQGDHRSLLSYDAACNLGLAHVRIKHVNDCPQVYDMLVQKYPTFYDSIGKLKNADIALHIDTSITPVAQAIHKIPFHMRQQVKKGIINLVKQGIIEKVGNLTPWVSPFVIIPKKNGEVCIWVDMRRTNKAINCERHSSPTSDNLFHNMNRATIFTKLDLRQG